MKKVFILTTVMAPYRIDVFNELGKKCDLVVCFEQEKDVSRNNEWYKKNIENFKMVHSKKWNKDLKYIKLDIIKILKKEKPNIIILYEYSTISAILVMQYCIIKNIPYLINCDGAIMQKNFIKDKIKTYYIKRATACLANGKHAKEYFIKYGAKEAKIFQHKFSSFYKNDILPEVVDRAKKEKLKRSLRLNYKRIYLSIGSFINIKGFDILIEAIGKVNNKDSGFIIIGGGEDLYKYQQIIEEYKITNIELVDFKSKDELLKYYDASDIFIFPTRGDIWGLVINEAMSRGLPIISTDKCIAALELVQDEVNGSIIRADAVQELVNIIKKYNKLLDEDLINLGKKSLDKIQDYNIEDIAQSHIEVLNYISEGKKF